MSRPDFRGASTALRACLGTCEAAVKAIEAGDARQPGAAITHVRHDFVMLAASLGKLSTELSLALKPPVTVSAVEGTAAKMQDGLAKLHVCLKSCPEAGLLSKQIQSTGLVLLQAQTRLLQGSLLALELEDALKRKRQRDTNLRLTGEVWSVVEQTQGIAADEVSARRAEWLGLLELLDDCIEEAAAVADEIEEEISSSSDAEQKHSAVSAQGRAETEQGRTDSSNCPKLAVELLQLGQVLVQHLMAKTGKPQGAETDVAALQAISAGLNALSASADELAMSLTPPFDDVVDSAREFVQSASTLKESLRDLLLGENEATWYEEWDANLRRTADAVSASATM
ncbi:hypothetical protein OIV83_006409 [Microbotryomycetes sp. JL201]|nr:hypothetical protein OIV83_006409 [Microbotryomycetes sp. JL201]